MSRSAVWEFFEKNEDGAVCTVPGCKKQLFRKLKSGSTKQFWDHLYHCHRELYLRAKRGKDSANIPCNNCQEFMEGTNNTVVLGLQPPEEVRSTT